MAFNIDNKQAEQSDVLPIGQYEIIIKKAEIKKTKNDKEYISIPLTVRNDIDQKFKDRIIWHSMWMLKEPTGADLACEGYSNKMIQIISKMTAIQNGKPYASLQDWVNDLSGKVAIVNIEHSEYEGKKRENVKYWEKTKFTTINHVFKEKAKSPDVPYSQDSSQDSYSPNSLGSDLSDIPTVSDDDLPF